MLELTCFKKSDGPLTKHISLGGDVKLISDGSACIMVNGRANRVCFDSVSAFAAFIEKMASTEALALGGLRADLPDSVSIVTKRRLASLKDSGNRDVIARTSEFLTYETGHPAFVRIDIDTKGMPKAVGKKIDAQGGFWAALCSVLPLLNETARLERASTSSGISRIDTGEILPGSNGMHVYLLIRDGVDAERFLRTLHSRCWLAGYGWHVVSASGQLLERSLVDRMVCAPERLVFEGPPVLEEPLVQDLAARAPKIFDGCGLDTRIVCPPLRITESAALKRHQAQSSYSFTSARAKEREMFIRHRVDDLATSAGITGQLARRTVDRQCDGILLPDLVLCWDDQELAGCTVRDVLTDPKRFLGATLEQNPFIRAHILQR